MIQGFDRLLIRVESLPAAIRFWQETHGATLVRQDRLAATLWLADGAEIVVHTDASRAAQQLYLLVEDVRAMHADRAQLRLEFRSPPTRGTRGYFATVRDPFGVLLDIADRSLEAEAEPPSDRLFDGEASRAVAHKPDRAKLAEIYAKLGRTADDLPYTTHFETLYDAYACCFADPKPSHAEVWRHLLTTRKAGALPKLGAARSTPPEIDDVDRARLRNLLAADIGKRDRLPYSSRFDDLVAAFNADRRRPYSPHQIWRLVATMAK